MQLKTTPPAFLDESLEGIPPESWMSYVLRGRSLVNANAGIGKELFLPDGATTRPMRLIALDPGNDAAKVGIVGRDKAFTALRIPTTFQSSRDIRHGGESLEEWTATAPFLKGAAPYWIGEDALLGESLPIGETASRLADARYPRFLLAAIVRALIAGGYSEGVYDIVLSIGVRNEEIKEQGGEQILDAAVKEALTLLKQTVTIERRTRAARERWVITIRRLMPAAQTLGTYFAWGYTPGGQAAQSELKKVTILDIGGGDTHVMQVQSMGGHLTVTAERSGDGMVEVARGLAAMVRERYGVSLTMAAAQYALVVGHVMVSGRETSIAPLLEQLKSSVVENALARVIDVLRRGDAFLILTAGGSALLSRELVSRMQLLGRDAHDYLVVPPTIASQLNCLGLYALGHFRATTK